MTIHEIPSSNNTHTISGLRGVIQNLEHHRNEAATRLYAVICILSEIKENGENEARGETLNRAIELAGLAQEELERLR